MPWKQMLLALVLAGVAACAKTDSAVPLLYRSPGLNADYCAKRVAVVKFEDRRKKAQIGDKRGETFFYPQGREVAEWISRAAADELSQAGCRVQYHEAMYPFDVDWVVTGAVDQVYIKQTSLIDYDGEMKVRMRLQTPDGRFAFDKDYYVNWAKTTVPSGREKEELLTQLLQDVMREAIPSLTARMK